MRRARAVHQLVEGHLAKAAIQQPAAQTPEEPEGGDAADEWRPPLAIGASLGDNLSAIQRADRQVQQWRAILAYHEEHLPDAVAEVQASLDEAITERNQLADTAANTTPAYVPLPGPSEAEHRR